MRTAKIRQGGTKEGKRTVKMPPCPEVEQVRAPKPSHEGMVEHQTRQLPGKKGKR
jgi:hypothetical protein